MAVYPSMVVCGVTCSDPFRRRSEFLMPERLSGVIERITFHNLDNGYCVLRVRAAGHRDVITVVGHAQQVIAGEYVQAAGEWVTDRTHGLQFKADEIKTNPPHTAEGITKYLGSGWSRGSARGTPGGSWTCSASGPWT